HVSVGTALGEPRDMPLWERSQVSREGVTCISCHRVTTQYGRINGERYIEPGNIHQPVYGPVGGEHVAKVIENKGKYRVATSDAERGKKIHNAAIKFDTLRSSEFCASCHQVTVNLGIKLEVVWDQYRDSPAKAAGVTCQDCHMGKVPGVPSGYETAPAAIINGEEINPGRKHANHTFFGPGYAIAHPGVFPHNPEAENWTMEDWLKFDYRAEWGREDFEDKIEEEELAVEFPEPWTERDDREEAREIIDANIEQLEVKRDLRRQVMENTSRIDGPYFDSGRKSGEGLAFHYVITNLNSGHNLPSGSLGAQPEIWLNVALVDPDGERVWESGYVDSHGDMADEHSLDVLAGKLPFDSQLFNLQTKFLTTNVKGTDREMYLPVNFDVDQLPLLRPPQQPVTVMNHPPFVRMEGRSLPPLASRKAIYSVPASAMTKPGKYTLAVRLRSRAEPIYFMKFVDGTDDMEQAMNEWMIDIHPQAVEFAVD
ncbi:MAG: cytochrome C, partial [Pseudomonadota bacterium]